MSTIESRIKPKGQNYRERFQCMKKLVDELHQNLELTKSEGPEKYIKRHKGSEKLLARERIQKIIDPGSEFLELMPMAGMEQKNMTLGGSLVGGIAQVEGVTCLINASVPTQKGGALNAISVLKQQRLDVIARENRLPVIYLTESAGADLPQQALVYNQGGTAFREISRRSKMGIPSITVVFGSSTAGGAYIPGMSDYTIMVKKQAKVYLAGPPLVKMATKEETTDEVLGGAEMHARLSGVCDFLASHEEEALQKAREILRHLTFPQPLLTPANYPEPQYDSEEILGIASTDIRRPFEAREIIARLVDDSDFLEFKPDFGPTLVTGHTQIHGHPVGIIANNGVLNNEASNKGAHFIQLCNQSKKPILFLQNITGFMVGTKVEQAGIIKDGAKMINAVSNSEVPMITILMGASYGAGNYAMCGRAFEPRFLFAWPNSKLAVMGPHQLAGVLEIIKREAAQKAGVKIDEEDIQKAKETTIQQIESESNAYFATSRVWDDGIIDPRDTRKIVGHCLKVIYQNPIRSQNRYGVYRM